MELHDAIEALDSDLQKLHKALFQYRSWLELQRRAGVNLDRAAAALLKAVAHGGAKGTRPHDIAMYLGIEAPSITRTAQPLELAGLLDRKPDPADGRAFILTITRKGRAQLTKLQRARQEQLSAALQGWSENDRATFIRLLRAFNEDLTNITTP